MKKTVLAIALATLLTACTGLSPEEQAAECRATDWQRFGVNDGRLGVPVGDRSGLFDDCADAGVPPDMTAYRTGRTQGLETFCTAENGYTVGREGRRYDRVCPSALEADFLQGYERGRKERPSVVLSPSIGVGSGGGVGIGIGIGLLHGSYGLNYGHRYRGYRRGWYGHPNYRHSRLGCLSVHYAQLC